MSMTYKARGEQRRDAREGMLPAVFVANPSYVDSKHVTGV